MAFFIDLMYYSFMFIASIKTLYIEWIVKSYEAIYQDRITHVDLFDMSNYDKQTLFKITWFQHLQNVGRWLLNPKQSYATPMWSNIETTFNVPSTSDTYIYEFTYYNGTKALIKTQGAIVPDAPPAPSKRAPKALHVGMGNDSHVADATNFVNKYVSSLTHQNGITANDIFILAILNNRTLGTHFSRNTIIDIEFITCHEIIEKTKFNGDDVVVMKH